MDILINKEIDKNIWNNLIKNKIFYRYEWFYIIKDSYGFEPFFILIKERDRFALIASFKTTKGYISLPFVSYSGFMSNDKELLKKLKSFLKEKDIEIDARDLIEEQTNSGYINPIAHFENEDDFWKKIQPRFRSLMRKSQKEGFDFEDGKDIETFYKIYSTGMRNLGTPVHKKRYFYEISKYLNFRIFIVKDGDKPIGAMFCPYDNDTLSVMYAYTLPQYSKRYANYFLYLNVVRWMFLKDLKYFDMGRSTYNEGTYHFKKKFRPKFYTIKSKINYTSNKKLLFISSCWKRLPLSVANFIGPKIRKYLP